MMPHKGASTQCHNQQVLAKPHHQPSNRDQQAREKLADGSLDSNLNSPPILYVIQEGLNCMPTTDYFFTNVKPTPIIVTHPAAHQNKPTSQQAATRDPISQQTHPLQPGKTRVYPSMLTNKQVPVLNLTETSITSQADLQGAFQSLCLCSHGRKESTEDQSTE